MAFLVELFVPEVYKYLANNKKCAWSFTSTILQLAVETYIRKNPSCLCQTSYISKVSILSCDPNTGTPDEQEFEHRLKNPTLLTLITCILTILSASPTSYDKHPLSQSRCTGIFLINRRMNFEHPTIGVVLLFVRSFLSNAFPDNKREYLSASEVVPFQTRSHLLSFPRVEQLSSILIL